MFQIRRAGRMAAAFLLACATWLAGCATAPLPPPPPPPPAPAPDRPSSPPVHARPDDGPPCLQGALAPFPWPDTPPPTASRLIVRDYLSPVPATLGGLLGTLRRELAAAGYPLPGVLGAGCNGFALVLEGERVNPDGSRAAFQEWNQRTHFTLAEVLHQLWTAEPGYYRMIVLVAATERPRYAGAPLSAHALAELADQGAEELPPAMAALPFSSDYELRALVYEFVRDNQGAAQVPPDGRIPVVTHLKSAGLLPSGVQ